MRKGILIIDPDKEEFQSFLNVLQHIQGGYHCKYATDGLSACKVLHRYLPGVIFINNELPQLSGLQFLSYIKSEERLQSIRVYIYATTISNEVNNMAQTLGASGCIEKTGCPQTFLRELKAILNPVLLSNYNFFNRRYSQSDRLSQYLEGDPLKLLPPPALLPTHHLITQVAI